MGTTTCVLGWGNAVVNYPSMLITSQVVDDDVKESIQKGELSRAGGQFLYNGATVVVPILKGGKILKTVGKTGKKTTTEADGKNDQADGSRNDTRKPCRTHSFLPGTRVLLANGSRKPIEQVLTGEKVVATDPVSGLTATRTVTDTITTEDDKDFTRLSVRVGGRTTTITATDTHPFWLTDQKRWAEASDIKPGAELRTLRGASLPVVKVSRYQKQQRTHDLTIKGIHTYYVLVGATPVLVHNSNCNVPSGSLDGQKLADKLRNESAGSPFTAGGSLTPDAIANSRLIMRGSDMGNKALRARFEERGGVAQWGKYSSETHQSPYGDYQVHYYMNRTSGEVMYDFDYKAVMNRR
jgi:hypothetical protein